MMPRQHYPLLLAVGFGLAIAAAARYLPYGSLDDWPWLLLTLTLVAPMALGGLAAHFVPAHQVCWRMLGAPAVAGFLFVASALIFNPKEIIATLLINLLFFPLAVIGAALYAVSTRFYQQRRS